MKCTKCVDQLIADDKDPATAPDAEIMIPFVQAVMTAQGNMVLGSAIMVCFDCRKKDLKPSRLLASGLS